MLGLALAPAAAAWLTHTTRARVLNVFDRACNLVNAQGEVLAVVTSERGLTPFALVVAASHSSPFHVITEASEIRVQPGSLQLGPYVIDLTAARPWHPAPDWPAIRRLLAEPARLDELAAMALGHGPAGSLLELFDPAGPAAKLPVALSSRVRPGALGLIGGWQSGDLVAAADGASHLGGLGGGLTPAGDDFVLGVLLAAWAGLYGPGAELGCPQIAEAAAQRTTTLSAAYLRAAARGECSAYWHSLFQALLRQDAPDTARGFVGAAGGRAYLRRRCAGGLSGPAPVQAGSGRWPTSHTWRRLTHANLDQERHHRHRRGNLPGRSTPGRRPDRAHGPRFAGRRRRGGGRCAANMCCPAALTSTRTWSCPLAARSPRTISTAATRRRPLAAPPRHIDFVIQDKGETLHQAVERWHRRSDHKAVIDYGYHMAITDLTPAVMDEIPSMAGRGHHHAQALHGL